MISVYELADWLINFHAAGGSVTVTCNGMGLLAWDKQGRHYFSIVGYDDIDFLFDAITPCL